MDVLLQFSVCRGQWFSVTFITFLFIFRSSDTASIKASILYHSIFQTMKEAFDGLAGRFQAYSLDDLDYTKYKERVEKEA